MKNRRVRPLSGVPGKVFVDSGAWIAWQSKSDQYHVRASSTWARLRVEGARIVTSTNILDETVTFLRYRFGLPLACQVGDAILASAQVELLQVDEACLRRAWQIFTSVEDLELSLTDCTSFALIEELGIRRVFTFDDDFRVTGVEMLG